MRQVSAALRAAIDSSERIIDSTFTVDWDNDGEQDIDDLSRKAENISLTQSLESSLPQAVQLVPGVAVAELTARLTRGNTNRYGVTSIFRSLTTSGVGSGSTTTWQVAKPSTARVGDIVLVAIFVSIPGLGNVMTSWQVIAKSNVTWLPMALRGDGLTGNTRLEGLLLYRRVAVDEPVNYVITLPTGSTVAYASTAVNIGDSYLMGVTDLVQKGEDNDPAPTGITLPQVKVDVAGSTIVSFFGAASYAISGVGFSPTDSNDVEQTEFTVNAAVSSKPSIRVSVDTHANATQGLYQKGVTFTGSAGSSAIATIGFSVVLAPKLAGDEAQHAAWTFSELNPNSPYAGKSRIKRRTRWAARLVTPSGGFESVPLFTGFTTVPSAASDWSATIKAIDNRETMRNTGQGLNLVAMYPVSQDASSGLSKPTMPGLETTWVISRSFINAFYRPRVATNGIFTYESQAPNITGLGYFPSPLASRYAVIWATMHGSAHNLLTGGSILYAYTETVNHGLQRRVRFEVGPYVAATKNEAPGLSTYMSWPISVYTVWQSTTSQMAGRVQCMVRRNTSTSYMKVDFPDNNGNVYDAWIEITTAGVLQFRVEKPSVSRTVVGPTITADALWHFVGVHFDSLAGTVTFRVDSTNTTVALTTWANTAIPFIISTGNVQLTDGMQLAEFQVAGGYTSSGQTGIPATDAWANENFTPTAFVDKTENLLDAMPFIDINADTFSVVSDIAAAEFAAFYFDEDGYPHYRNSRSDASTTGQTVQRSITARRSIESIAYESGVAQIRNIVTIGYTPFAPSTNTTIFSASGAIGVLPNETKTFTVTVQGPITGNTTVTYSAYSQIDGTGSNITAMVNVNIVLSTANYVTVQVKNNAGSTAYLVDNTGQPNLKVIATVFLPLTDGDSIITYSDADSIREFGEQPLPSQGTSPWVQNEESAASLALKLLSDLCQPKPVITSLQIKGDPTLQFGDLVTITDTNGLGVNGQYRITSKDPSMSADGFTQTLVVRSAPSIAYWDTNYWDDGTVWG
jgi:hypothetical protein